MLSKLVEYVELLKAMSLTDFLKLLAWYLRLKSYVEVKVGKHTLRLHSDVKSGEGIWRVKVLMRALRSSLRVELDYENNKLKISTHGVLFEESMDYYGYLVLQYLQQLLRVGACLERDLVVLPNGIKLKYPVDDPVALSVVYDAFVERLWGFLNVRGKTVVDVGAYVGESAISFVLRGARRVVCYEPNPVLYSYLLENIRMNRLDDRIVALNYAVASKEGFIKLCIPRGRVFACASTRLLKDSTCMCVRAVKLPLEGDVLKMDCEGCEFDVLPSIPYGKLSYEEIGLEYHGPPKPLIKLLRRHGYRVKIVKRSASDRGLLYARQG